MMMEKQMEQARRVGMTFCAASGSIRLTGLPANEHGQLPHMQILVNPAERKMLLCSWLAAALPDDGISSGLLFDLAEAEALPCDRQLQRSARKTIPLGIV